MEIVKIFSHKILIKVIIQKKLFPNFNYDTAFGIYDFKIVWDELNLFIRLKKEKKIKDPSVWLTMWEGRVCCSGGSWGYTPSRKYY